MPCMISILKVAAVRGIVVELSSSLGEFSKYSFVDTAQLISIQSRIRRYVAGLYLLIIEGIHSLGQGLSLLGVDERHNAWFARFVELA